MQKDARVAVINEPACIGCTKCLDVCPTDAILGASKQMHVVLTAECIGCELCLPPCPMQCIDMVPMENLNESEKRLRAENGKRRVKARKQRLDKRALQKAETDKIYTQANVKSLIENAVKRVQEKQYEQKEH
jgi:electron transport complex protein RnfB